MEGYQKRDKDTLKWTRPGLKIGQQKSEGST